MTTTHLPIGVRPQLVHSLRANLADFAGLGPIELEHWLDQDLVRLGEMVLDMHAFITERTPS